MTRGKHNMIVCVYIYMHTDTCTQWGREAISVHCAFKSQIEGTLLKINLTIEFVGKTVAVPSFTFSLNLIYESPSVFALKHYY